MRFLILLIILLHLIPSMVQAQQVLLKGEVRDEKGQAIAEVNISLRAGKGTFSDDSGNFFLLVQPNQDIVLDFSHINYQRFTDTVSVGDEEVFLNIVLREKTTLLDEVSIRDEPDREQVSLTKLEPKNLSSFPTPTPDISRILVSLPGVVSNNELSSSYSVRGGNFDENLIFVEGIPIYKPQIVTNGQQEGLGFVNLSMVKSVNFSSGGWSSRYGDRLSSVLNINYKVPQEFTLDAAAGLLGGHATVGSKVGNTSFIGGIRHKNIRYILNTLEVEGEYFPRFTDFQLFTTTALDESLSISFLAGYANNSYEVFPATRETEFGTFNKALRLIVGFEGRDVLTYNTYQGGVKLDKQWSPGFRSSFIISAVKTLETEYTEVEGGYRLCDVNKDIGSGSFNECAVIRGIGTLYDHRRNYLKGNMLRLEWLNEVELSDGSAVQGGFSWNYEAFDDRLSEYSFTDSADYVTEIKTLNSDPELRRTQLTGFLQWEKDLGQHYFSAGSRFIYRALTDEFTISPRVQYAYGPEGNNDIIWKLATGIYRQLPVYREFRQLDGTLNKNLKMQSSWHIIAGMDKDLVFWDRPFKLITEAYYKYLWNVNPFEVNNVRIRYFGTNDAKAYATGADFRLSGEFIKNTESWFSLSFLSTKEDVKGDNQGYIRRPMDQRMTMAVFFQDHLPDNPTFRVNVHILIGSGLPFGPPNDLINRNFFRGDAYRRVDVGFSKVFNKWKGIEEFIISAEVLNLTGSQNVISYTWIEDVHDQQFAVPNTLSARFLNIQLRVKI